ncbi:unnamed protein product [Phyllotreta striolata]|uniref:Cilia- and flagella-associated protein 61 N-terminal domain-containing protein n=1 Tax=Phyllotreta striolata TaxID=444603 RepID=A0A9N9XMV5_PHYSR|nr:unnamed protein product [Phyllotreta striolata]
MSIRSKTSRATVVLSPENIIRLSSEHTKSVQKLFVLRDNIFKLFGPQIEVERLLTLCYLSLGILDDEGRIVGALFVQPFPNISSLPASEWTTWLQNKYGLSDVITKNTLFIHLAICDPIYQMIYFKPLLQHLFKTILLLKYAIIVVPPGRQRLEFTMNMGIPVIAPKCKKGQSTYLLLFCRSTFSIVYKIRRAVEEDNDDLVPLIATYSPRFTELYGKYYFAEILMNKQLGRHLIVAEYQGSAVAVLCLNKVVNYEVLNEEFELVPYNGLKKPHPKDYEDFDFNIAQTSTDKLMKSAKEEDITAIFEKGSAGDSDKTGDGEMEEVVSHVSYTESDEFSIIFTSASMFVFQDDEESDVSKKGSQESSSSSRLVSQYKSYDKDTSAKEADVAYEYQSIYSASRIYMQKIPEFKGEENAFVIEIAAALPNHEEGIMELFDAAFDCIPDRDYCVMAVPPTVPVNKLTRFFTRVPPRATGTFPFDLYVMHRNAMLANIEVEEVSKEHETAVKQLLTTIPNHKKVYELLQDSINEPLTPYSSFVALTDNQVIGLAIVSEERDIDYLTAHYDLSVINLKMYRSGTHGTLQCLLLSPIFQRYDKYFLREIHRMSEFEILYYKHSAFDSSETLRDKPLMNILFDFLPIMPTMQPQYDMTELNDAECAPSTTVIEKKESFALYVSTLPLASLERNVVNTRILVLGCSHTALSFLKALLLKQSPNHMVTFNSVTLLCSVGLIHTRVNPRIREMFLVKKNFLDARHMDCISLKTYVNFIQGKITKLERRDKYIVINGTQFVDYDTLVLMCGEQFQRITRGTNMGQIRPDNVMYLNNVLEANNAILKLKQLYHKHNSNNYKIIIYGHFLQAHTAISGLINYGVPAYHLVLIEPFPYIMSLEKKQRPNVSIYNDPDIDDVVYEHISNAGVKIYQSYYFIDWQYDEETNLITSAKFESKHKMLEQECLAMFMFHEKEISPRMYKVLNSAGLVYDGRLVISAECQTNDPNIFAAGTLTKYSRKYHGPTMTHKFYSRVEVGRRLGIQIRNMLIQQKVRKWSQESAVGWNFHIERGDLVVPRYQDPLMRYCRLPGGIYYLSIVKPGKRMPLETAVSMEHYGQVLITGTCKNIAKQGYFRLHLNQYKRVETITCLHVQPIDYYNLYCLWGKHEKLLNNLMLRFEMVLITDLFEYFKQPWVYAIYHEKFNNLMDELNMLMTSSIGSSEESIINVLINLYKKNKWRPLPKEDKEYLEKTFRALGYSRIIEQKVLKFIKANMQHLPMYAHPTIVRKLLDNFNLSSLFTE